MRNHNIDHNIDSIHKFITLRIKSPQMCCTLDILY